MKMILAVVEVVEMELTAAWSWLLVSLGHLTLVGDVGTYSGE